MSASISKILSGANQVEGVVSTVQSAVASTPATPADALASVSIPTSAVETKSQEEIRKQITAHQAEEARLSGLLK